jgi:hypothetical protein
MQTKAMPNEVDEEVVRWRFRQLTDSGFAPAVAAEVAPDSRFDLHSLIELVEHGCSPDLAVRIRAPIDDRPEA